MIELKKRHIFMLSAASVFSAWIWFVWVWYQITNLG